MSLCMELVWSLVTLEGKTLVPVSDLCTVQTFTFFQGKCIQALEWLDLLPCTALAATFSLFWCLLLEQACVPPLFLQSTGQCQGDLPSGMASLCLHRELLLKSKAKPPPFTQKSSLAFLTLIQKATPLLPSLCLVTVKPFQTHVW